MHIETIGILGAGQMGSGIARVCLDAGLYVILHDTNVDALKRAADRLSKKQIHFTQDLKKIEGADFVIEAIVENKRKKMKLFAELDRFVPSDVIFASNTSTILIRELAKSINRKDRFVGMHFMNPPHVLTLLEIVRGPETSEETLKVVMPLASRLGRDPVLEAPDIRGFAVNGIVLPLINEAALLLTRVLETGKPWQEACKLVDQIFEGRVKTGTTPLGALTLADAIGIDTCVSGLHELAKDNRHYRPHSLLRQLVAEGRLGRKTREGFFKY